MGTVTRVVLSSFIGLVVSRWGVPPKPSSPFSLSFTTPQKILKQRSACLNILASYNSYKELWLAIDGVEGLAHQHRRILSCHLYSREIEQMASAQTPNQSTAKQQKQQAQDLEDGNKQVKLRRAFHRKVKTGCRTCKSVPLYPLRSLPQSKKTLHSLPSCRIGDSALLTCMPLLLDCGEFGVMRANPLVNDA